MSIEVKIPAVGESITSGVVSVWHKKSGDFVNAGEPLFTLETDKVSTEIVAEKAGVLETKVPEGQEVKIGEVVATIDDSKSAPAEKSCAGRKRPRQQKETVAASMPDRAAGRPRLHLFRRRCAASLKKNMSCPRKFPEQAKRGA